MSDAIKIFVIPESEASRESIVLNQDLAMTLG